MISDQVRSLFQEVADLSEAERDEIFAARAVAAEVRSEVELLLRFDSTGDGLTRRVSEAAGHAVRSSEELPFAACGPYRLVRLVGSGGMGAVYLAERTDDEIQQFVAVKLLHTGTSQRAWLDRFLKERRLLASMNHPSIARLIDSGRTSDGRPYLVMEFVDGLPIDVYAADKDLRHQLELFLRVCDGVAHAHRHLIVHRDLKPSNILVDSSGQPKLLDFGIAKLLDETSDPTRTAERFLTPSYASPEQLRGVIQTTATDVYSLGAILYRILAGRSPHESKEHVSKALEAAAGTWEIPAPRRLNKSVPADLDFVVRKALRREPEERYPSVESFASDIRAFLDSRPVQARAGDMWYRAHKFLRRHWGALAAAALVMASLSAGLYVATRERFKAEQRFAQLRELSKKVFDLDASIRNLPGSTSARQRLVSASLQYLQGLSLDPRQDPELAEEVAEGYWRAGRIQGVPTELNLGQSAQAEASLKRAAELTDAVLAARPHDRSALRNSAAIAHDRMILAESDHRQADAIAHAHKAAERIDLFLRSGDVSPANLDGAAALYGNIALADNNMHMYADAARFARKSVELARPFPSEQLRVGQGLSLLANALRYQGDLEGALEAIQDARSLAEHAPYNNPTQRMIDLYGVLLREGMILGEDGGVNLDRPAEAITVFREALDLTGQAARKDPNDAASRSRMGTSARELANILRHRDPAEALAVYDLGIRRLGEIPGNLKALRDQAVLFAGSSYPLRTLHRESEARQRLDRALAVLKDTKDYPVARIGLDSEVYSVLKAIADNAAAAGKPDQALQMYQRLFDQVTAAQSDPYNDLRDAPRISQLCQALAELYRRTHDRTKAEEMESRRQGLWRNWEQKLPGNAFVLRQRAALQ